MANKMPMANQQHYTVSLETNNVVFFPQNTDIGYGDCLEWGWYYVEEDGWLEGPFESEKIALRNLKAYYRFLNSQTD